MSILSVTTDFTGQIGVNPRLVRIVSNDPYAEVIATNWLQPIVKSGYVFYPTDVFYIAYGTSASTVGIFTANITVNGIITLVPFFGDGSIQPSDPSLTTVAMVNTPIVQNHIATYADNNGSIGDDAITAINGGNIQAGLTNSSGSAGALISCPSTANKGTLKLAAIANVANFNVTISNRAMNQSTTLELGDPGQATASILISKVFADPNANIIDFDVTLTAAALGAGPVTLYTSSSLAQYKVRRLISNGFGTNFSGGGGDRLLVITDNTTNYSLIPAANLQALANSSWGSAALPFPASAAINTSTQPGISLFAKYSGGTANYTTGSVVISCELERVA